MKRRPSNQSCVLALVFMMVSGATALAGEATPSKYRGWDSIRLDNGLVEVQVVPAVGGRVIQLSLGGFEYLWVNPQLAGQQPPPSGLAPDGGWLNYGGDKIWPAPQGWDNDQQWPGPPDAVLDGSPYAAAIQSAAGDMVSVQLTSPKDPRSGVQFSRIIKVYNGAARVSFDTTMKNIDTKPRRWGIWQVTQHNAGASGGTGYDPNLYCYCPANPSSKYARGYNEMFGLVNNPSFHRDVQNQLVCAHYQRMVGKIGVDCAAGWMAVVNGTAGYVLVERFTYQADKPYPDGASVEFWMNGAGAYVVGNKIIEAKDDPVETPYLAESEVLSPFAELKPGETYTFHLDWFAAKIGGNFPILACSDVGVNCERLVAKVTTGGLGLSGRFGVFYPGKLGCTLLDERGREVGRGEPSLAVSPTEPLVLANWPGAASPSADAKTVALILYGSDGKPRGELARAALQR